MPPESRGALIKSIADAYVQQKNPGNLELKTSASYSINELLSTIQSNGQLFNTLDRVNLAFGDESGRNQGIQLINSIVSGTKFDSCIDRCTMQLATANPLLGRAFLRNDEPDFRVAQFPLHNSAYNTA